MKYYYYAYNDHPFGPYTIDELKAMRLKKPTLVWTEGFQDWTSVDDIEELKNIFIFEPPPLHIIRTTTPSGEHIQIKQTPTPVKSTKFDLTYEKETDATLLGILLLVVLVIIRLIGKVTYDSVESYKDSMLAYFLIQLFVRISVTVKVVRIASRQNRNSIGWGFFAFFFPILALTVIGLLKKIKLKIELDSSLSANRQVAILLKKANKLFSRDRYLECIEILNKAIEIENQNFECIKLRGLSNYFIMNYSIAKSDFEFLISNEKFPSIANYCLGNLAMMDRDRKLAISFWQKAAELNNKTAKMKLEHLNTYPGKYLLNKSQTLRKVNCNLARQFIIFGNGRYKGGLLLLDEIEKPDSLRTQIYGYDYGLDIRLWRTFKTYHLAISYFEIDNIIYKNVDKIFELHLADKNILTFSYDQIKDKNKGLKKICNKFKQATGKTAEAASSWKE